MTNADRQRAFRRRQITRITELEAEVDTVRSELDAALAEVERLSAAQCKHPAAAVDGGHCHARGGEVW
jgi:hypothetical protein